MKPTLAQIEKWYAEYNARVFSNELPASLPFIFTNTRSYLGRATWNRTGFSYKYTIRISTYFDCTEKDFRNTLVHEMCHIYCFVKGWLKEHHGARWKAIARKASLITGLDISRTADITGWQVSEENKIREERKQARKEAPSIILDIAYSKGGHFLIKVSKNVFQKNIAWHNGAYQLNTRKQVYGIYISDNPLFRNWQSSRTIGRGYPYTDYEYERKIKPILDKAIKVEQAIDITRGHYDFLQVR